MNLNHHLQTVLFWDRLQKFYRTVPRLSNTTDFEHSLNTFGVGRTTSNWRWGLLWRVFSQHGRFLHLAVAQEWQRSEGRRGQFSPQLKGSGCRCSRPGWRWTRWNLILRRQRSPGLVEMQTRNLRALHVTLPLKSYLPKLPAQDW